MATAVQRLFNFSAGPAILPVPVLEEAQRDLIALPGVGMSVLEVSHRSKAFESILAAAEADVRSLGNVPSNYRVLFLQGGASLQFSMVPLNLLTDWKSMLGFAFNTNLNGTVNLFARDNIRLYLAVFLSDAQVGYYSLAARLINLVMLPIEPFIWPTYAEITKTISL